jgi:hypothetical protein
MNIAKEKQSIIDYVAGLQDSEAVQDLKNFIKSLKEKDSSNYNSIENNTHSLVNEPPTEYKENPDVVLEEDGYELTPKGLQMLEKRRQEYLNGGKTLSEKEANDLAKKWL